MQSRIINKETRVAEAKSRFGVKYDYDSVPENLGNKEEFNLKCNDCGTTMSTTWNKLLHVRNTLGGCRVCGRKFVAAKFAETLDGFLKKSIEKHGERYDYKEVQFMGNKVAVDIICKQHGVFSQRPDKHKLGHGCPTCVKNGFRVNKSGKLYILKDGLYVKVGITNRDIKTRIREVNYCGLNFTLVREFYFTNGKDCLDIETRLLSHLKSLYSPLSERFNGSSECFANVDIEYVIRKVETMIKEGEYE